MAINFRADGKKKGRKKRRVSLREGRLLSCRITEKQRNRASDGRAKRTGVAVILQQITALSCTKMVIRRRFLLLDVATRRSG